MAIGGKKREQTNFEQPKYVGLFQARVIAINPDIEEFESLMGWKPAEDSKQFEYLGESKDGNDYLRVDVWLEETRTRKRDDQEVSEKFKVTFFLENKERENKDKTKKQYINSVGVCSWASDPNDLPEWFREREYRVAYNGEEEFYNFLRMWLSKLDYRDTETTLSLEWRKLMKGNLKEVREQINGEMCDDIVALATIDVSEKDGEVKEYQRVYNDGFLSRYSLKHFRANNYTSKEAVARLRAKKKLAPHEKFVLNVTHEEHGCRDFYILKDMEEYDPEKNIVSSDKVIEDSDSSY